MTKQISQKLSWRRQTAYKKEQGGSPGERCALQRKTGIDGEGLKYDSKESSRI